MVSSHFDRCLMSANSFMAGLYPPTDEFLFEKGLNWQAYPTHMISADIDYVCCTFFHIVRPMLKKINYARFWSICLY